LDPEGSSSDILQFTRLFLNLDSLSVVKYSEKGTEPASRHETSPSFRDVLIPEHVYYVREGGFVRGHLQVPGGLWFQKPSKHYSINLGDQN